VSSTDIRSNSSADAVTCDLKLEVVTLPVADVERAKAFYESLGWRLDADMVTGENYRDIHFTPPHSSCSIAFGKGLTNAAPGSAQRLILAVADIDAARNSLVERGIDVSEVFHLDGRPGLRSRSGASLVQVLRVVLRPRRQRICAAGGHEPASRPRVGRLNLLRNSPRNSAHSGHERGGRDAVDAAAPGSGPGCCTDATALASYDQ